jgi:hypothetical protein
MLLIGVAEFFIKLSCFTTIRNSRKMKKTQNLEKVLFCPASKAVAHYAYVSKMRTDLMVFTHFV